MPIQFRCQKCSQWLEVDEPHAGGKAICPYCQAVNDVPKQTAEPKTQAEAPAGPGEPPQEGEKTPYTGVPTEQTRPTAPEVPVSKPLEEEEHRRQTPAPREYEEGWFDAGRSGLPKPPGAGLMGRLGLIGLSLSIISVVACFAAVLAMVSFLPAEFRDELAKGAATQETMEQMQKHIIAVAKDHPWILNVLLVSFLAGIVGFGMSLVAVLTPGAHRRGAAWAGVIIGGLLFLCLCSSIMQQIAGVLTK